MRFAQKERCWKFLFNFTRRQCNKETVMHYNVLSLAAVKNVCEGEDHFCNFSVVQPFVSKITGTNKKELLLVTRSHKPTWDITYTMTACSMIRFACKHGHTIDIMTIFWNVFSVPHGS